MPDDQNNLERLREFFSLLRFKEHLSYVENLTDDELEKFYDKSFNIEFDGHTVSIPFNADNHYKIFDLITAVLEEYQNEV